MHYSDEASFFVFSKYYGTPCSYADRQIVARDVFEIELSKVLLQSLNILILTTGTFLDYFAHL